MKTLGWKSVDSSFLLILPGCIIYENPFWLKWGHRNKWFPWSVNHKPYILWFCHCSYIRKYACIMCVPFLQCFSFNSNKTSTGSLLSTLLPSVCSPPITAIALYSQCSLEKILSHWHLLSVLSDCQLCVCVSVSVPLSFLTLLFPSNPIKIVFVKLPHC